MNKYHVKQLFYITLLTALLSACAGVQAPASTAGTPGADTTAVATVAPAGEAEATVEPTTMITDTTTEATMEATGEATGEPTEEPAQEATTEPTEEATGEAVGETTTVTPIDAAECEELRAAIAERLDVEFTAAEADFSNEIAGHEGTACTLSATGTGEDFGNFVDAAQSIRDVLTEAGWTENTAYLADGPTGTASGYELENKLAFVSVDWQPSAAVQCPADQPISACEVQPDQQVFTVVIELVAG